MKRTLFSVLAFLFVMGMPLAGQQNDIEGYMTRKYLPCEDIMYNCSFLIPEFYEKNELDSLHMVIDFWKSHCGTPAILRRCDIILSIEEGNFSEDLYDEGILNSLYDYKKYKDGSLNGWYSIPRMYSHKMVDFNRMDSFLVDLSRSLIESDNLSELERMLLDVYSHSNERTLMALLDDEYSGTKLQEYYQAKLKEIKNDPVYNLDILAGCWVPFDQLATIGVHPLIGLRGGIWWENFTLNLSSSVRMGRSRNPIEVIENQELWTTDEHVGGHMGLHTGTSIINGGKSKFSIVGGVALDWMEVLTVTDTEENLELIKNLGSLNLNAGLSYTYNIDKYRYLGIEAKYNFLNYINQGGTNISGNAITINLLYGFTNKQYKDNRLERLDYH